ncbi:MAG: hypothetical protein K2X86_15630 [Cytophagaceae bacterium]|nr:hypothetical protein [Cytophagaceae bacterium]
MQTVIVQLTHQKALRLLEELEDLHILRVLKKNINPNEKLSDKYSGKLSADVADKIQKHISDSRNQWDSNS